MGGCLVLAALVIRPSNSLAANWAPYFKVLFESSSIEKQFVAQMTEQMKREPKGDLPKGSKVAGITVSNIKAEKYMGDVPSIRIEYSLQFSPSGSYPYSEWVWRVPVTIGGQPTGKYSYDGKYIGMGRYGMRIGEKVGFVQATRLRIE
ncbi:hypothetical protein EON80_06525 [bacterium]|nr:MAG: hypothetical protein EON80_06525 [bacterium]